MVFGHQNPGAQAFVVVALVPGRPAELSGKIAIGDCLTAVDDVSVQGLSLPEVTSRILGPGGTRFRGTRKLAAELTTTTTIRT